MLKLRDSLCLASSPPNLTQTLRLLSPPSPLPPPAPPVSLPPHITKHREIVLPQSSPSSEPVNLAISQRSMFVPAAAHAPACRRIRVRRAHVRWGSKKRRIPCWHVHHLLWGWQRRQQKSLAAAVTCTHLRATPGAANRTCSHLIALLKLDSDLQQYIIIQQHCRRR